MFVVNDSSINYWQNFTGKHKAHNQVEPRHSLLEPSAVLAQTGSTLAPAACHGATAVSAVTRNRLERSEAGAGAGAGVPRNRAVAGISIIPFAKNWAAKSKLKPGAERQGTNTQKINDNFELQGVKPWKIIYFYTCTTTDYTEHFTGTFVLQSFQCFLSFHISLARLNAEHSALSLSCVWPSGELRKFNTFQENAWHNFLQLIWKVLIQYGAVFLLRWDVQFHGDKMWNLLSTKSGYIHKCVG